ncbi:PAP2 domain-containing protein [Histoplasma capsulatum G186AR]|uniref:PAP2 domain-containing protein n=2 Tax=Ajellomyces capsulatus TaxID=5037 RepID=C0NJI9_AJECG|nr:PAP2 domain-containing protein [Histoplasma capsulatum G186AR]EEH08030.1 PAP2 domain-containing protein [Histoplasma capsulatum G186AR]KAG5299644.1 PAP2 domain-containing protein [Histoplasma capsulatum]QSS67730.1 PAP2 domain-containing protein [Histoplasma capsulatum G186AR]
MAIANLVASSRHDWRFSKRLILSYVLDWILILATAAAGRILKFAEPNRHPFSLSDPSISFPFTVDESVTVTVLVLVSLVVPAAIILLVCVFFIQELTADRNAPKARVWQRKLWELNVGWMGLGIACAGSYVSTEAIKLIYGKPRPDLLSRCMPNLSDISSHVVGGQGQVIDGAPILVSYTICQETSEKLTREGFVSFPSGHSSLSFACLTYLSLWLCAKFSISIPYLAPRHYTQDTSTQQTARLANTHTSIKSEHDGEPTHSDANLIPIRKQSAAPPIYLLIIVAAPIATATYIASSRWADNRHAGFDVLGGSLLGIFFAFLGFRWYHPPLSAGGAGWAWGARAPEKAFFAGIGVNGYVKHEGLENGRTSSLSPSSLRRIAQSGDNNV